VVNLEAPETLDRLVFDVTCLALLLQLGNMLLDARVSTVLEWLSRGLVKWPAFLQRHLGWHIEGISLLGFGHWISLVSTLHTIKAWLEIFLLWVYPDLLLTQLYDAAGDNSQIVDGSQVYWHQEADRAEAFPADREVAYL
jgi:hypothetical protein